VEIEQEVKRADKKTKRHMKQAPMERADIDEVKLRDIIPVLLIV
jgi:hypothetical protein